MSPLTGILLKTKNIVETAKGEGSVKMFLKAVRMAGINETLSEQGPFTVFAPNDAAFGKPVKGSVENLFDDHDGLASLLAYHVVPGRITSEDMSRKKPLKTLLGSDIYPGVSPEGLVVNNARVIKTDIECSNGIIHIVDSVLAP